MNYAKYLLLLSLVVFTSCKYEIDYDADLPEDRLVIAAFAEEDSIISFDVFHSARPGVFSGDYYDGYKKRLSVKKSHYYDDMVKNAHIKLYDNKSSLSYDATLSGECTYTFDYVPKSNDNIKITVKSDKYPDIESNIVFDLKEPNISKFDWSFYVSEGTPQIIITIEIDDDGGENYYMFNPYKITYDAIRGLIYYNMPVVVSESHAGVYYEQNNNEFDDDEQYNEFGVISNKKFRGEKYSVKLAYDCYYEAYENPNMIQGWYEVMKIDRNAYNYLYSLGNAINNWGLNVYPVSIQNAWDNAYGFIGVKKTKRLYINKK